MNPEGREEAGLREQIRRELGVMFSRRHQPIPLRVAKWAVFLAVAQRLYGTRWFRAWAFGLPTMGLGAHFFYRYMTRGWTEPWGGWTDVGPPASQTFTFAHLYPPPQYVESQRLA